MGVGVFAEHTLANGDALVAINSAADGTGAGFAIWGISGQTGGTVIGAMLRTTTYTANSAISGYSNANQSIGVVGASENNRGTGVRGINSAANGTQDGSGGLFTTNQTGGTGVGGGLRTNTFFSNSGVSGIAAAGVPFGVGVIGGCDNNTGTGVIGQSNGGEAIGVLGLVNQPDAVGVQGENSSTIGGAGVLGFGRDGVVGISNDPINGWGVISFGDFGATGGKFFTIDHPLDPSNKILNHSVIESNEILNLYRGNVILNESGSAIVELPDYFEAININFSYHLTPIGAPGPNLYVSREVSGNSFEIAGGNPGMKVSWTVQAERNDRYMQAYPHKRIMEVEKTGDMKGKYLDYRIWNQPESKGIYNNENSRREVIQVKEMPEIRELKKEEPANKSSEIKRRDKTEMKKY